MDAQIILSTILALAPSAPPPGIEVPFSPEVALESTESPDEEAEGIEWGSCAGYAAMTALQCSLVFPLTCIASTVLAACECMPLILDEFEDYSCPGLG